MRAVEQPRRGHESSAIAVGTLLRIGAVILVSAIVITAGIGLALRHWLQPQHAAVISRAGAVPPVPRLQSAPQQDLAAERAQVRRELSDWRWTDRSHAFAVIPIERAMELYAQRRAAGATDPGAIQ
jgi:hypothetical protein